MRERRLGQVLGFSIGIAALACGTYASVNGAELAGGLIGGGGIIGLVGAFLYSKRRV